MKQMSTILNLLTTKVLKIAYLMTHLLKISEYYLNEEKKDILLTSEIQMTDRKYFHITN